MQHLHRRNAHGLLAVACEHQDLVVQRLPHQIPAHRNRECGQARAHVVLHVAEIGGLVDEGALLREKGHHGLHHLLETNLHIEEGSE